MKKEMALLSLVLCLSACGGSPQQQQHLTVQQESEVRPINDLALKKSREESAWSRVGTLSVTTCNFKPTPPERAKAVALSNCVSRLVNTHVLPNAAFPDIVQSDREEALRIADKYARGEISAPQYKTLSQERVGNYKSAWRNLADQQLLDAAEQRWEGDIMPSAGSR